MDRDQAAEEFVRMVVKVGLEQAFQALQNTLHHPVGIAQEKWKEIGSWYHQRNVQEQKNIDEIIREAIILSLHGILVSFDGAREFHFADDKPMDFTVVANLYADTDAAIDGMPLESIQIAPPTEGLDLHDIFYYHIEGSGSET